MQHPPTTQLSDLHQQSATRAVYDNPPAIESSRRLVLRAVLRLRRRGPDRVGCADAAPVHRTA